MVVRRYPTAWRRQRGSIAIMFIAAVLVILGFFGLALDLSMLYNRKMEMQNVADTAALAAAYELNGTPAGINLARQRAADRFTLPAGTITGSVLSYQYAQRAMVWSDNAIAFAASPDGPWLSAGAAAAQPGGLAYVRVDTAGLDPAYGEVSTFFMPVLNADLRMASTAASAVAGRTAIKVLPLGVCAMRPEAARNRGGELEQYGFRRGVAYDLMRLNPGGTGEGKSWLIHPMAAPGSLASVGTPNAALAAPFVCTGTMAMSRVRGGEVTVTSPFPLAELAASLNSRFESYTAPCNPITAPPDGNVKEYKFDSGASWMSAVPAGQAAAESTADSKLGTVAGPADTPSDTTAEKFGVLWSYARAARYASYVEGTPEPAAGYTTYAPADWSTLYSPGKPKANSYPASTPYAPTGGAHFTASVRKGVTGRRVLNVALLACPVTANKATILGIGKFFMPVRASSTHLVGEFAGLASEHSLGTDVRLYQ